MKKSGKLVTGILALMMVGVTVLPAMANYAVSHRLVHLPANQVWMPGGSVWHTPGIKGAVVQCHSVYPDKEGTDNYQYIRCRIVDNYGIIVSMESDKKIQEGTGYQDMELRDGYTQSGTLNFHFRGNTKESAYTDVSYKGDWELHN